MNKYAWITVNRLCNLHCTWCYVGEEGKIGPSLMNPELLHKLIDLCADGGIKRIIFIGGEPTIYPYLLEGVHHCRMRSLSSQIVTNGVRLSDKAYFDKLLEAGLDSVILSLKGSYRHGFEQTTGLDRFDAVIEALMILSRSKIQFSVSAVLTTVFVSHLDVIASELKRNGVKRIVFSFLKESADGNDEQLLSENRPEIILPLLFEKINSLETIFSNIDWCIETCLPSIEIDSSFSDFYKNRFHHSCKQANTAPLVFDTAARLLYCNAMPNISYGSYGTDFLTYEQLLQHVKKGYNEMV